MMQFTKEYFSGTVASFDGRIYQISIPDGRIVILKHATVHQKCQFPADMLEDEHLKIGASIRLCKIVKSDKESFLPDHRYYFSKTDFSELSGINSDDPCSIEEFTAVLVKASADKTLNNAVKEAMKLFALGFASAAVILLTTLLKITKSIEKNELK